MSRHKPSLCCLNIPIHCTEHDDAHVRCFVNSKKVSPLSIEQYNHMLLNDAFLSAYLNAELSDECIDNLYHDVCIKLVGSLTWFFRLYGNAGRFLNHTGVTGVPFTLPWRPRGQPGAALDVHGCTVRLSIRNIKRESFLLCLYCQQNSTMFNSSVISFFAYIVNKIQRYVFQKRIHA